MKSDIELTLCDLERMRSIDVKKNNHHYIELSHLSKWIVTCAAPASSGVLLDYGCGGQPYRSTFEPYITKYIGADVVAAKGVELDIKFSLSEQLPLPDGSVDTVLSTQVLEHVYDFRAYLAESARVLRPQGRLIISVPMHWRHHEVPYDYWRFTKYGLQKSLQLAGFEVLDLRSRGGVYSLLGQIFLDHRATLNKFNPFVARVINCLALWLDKKTIDQDDTLGWMCIAQKL